MHDEGVSHESCNYVWSASAIGCAIHDMDFAVKVRWIFVQPPGKEQGFTANTQPSCPRRTPPVEELKGKISGVLESALCQKRTRAAWRL